MKRGDEMGKKLFKFDDDLKWDYENGFYLTSHITRMAKMLAHYELYKMIVNLPGQVVECGVYKGASLVRFATYREILENPYSRKIIGFDAFGKFPKADDSYDAKFIEKFEIEGGHGISIGELEEVFRHKSFENYEFIEGDIVKTVPKYLTEHRELKIALLHIDVDVYGASVIILKELFDRVVRGGLVVFDDYGTVSGETRAIDEFFIKKNVIIEKLPISHIPSYVRKK